MKNTPQDVGHDAVQFLRDLNEFYNEVATSRAHPQAMLTPDGWVFCQCEEHASMEGLGEND